MSTAGAPAGALSAPAKATKKSWETWLRAHIDPAWRPGEWDSVRWLFTGDLDNPRTSSSRCRTRRCDVIVRAQETFCTHCSDQRRKSGLPREEFAAFFTPARSRSLPLTVVGPCTLTRDGVQCVRPQVSGGLCAELENARQEIRSLRQERDRLRDAMRHQLGQQLDSLITPDLANRVDELTHHNHQLADQLQRATDENTALHARANSLEQDLAAARTGLRRMIRSENTAR
ncbi:hypothetical protein ACFYRJ_36615 [Streptomyces sp. NPDC005531]|uniref:hypothetical protein n=1 Tax=Streptomyces sp. NPDC005531 TaxID=3364722 RepID=UPI00367EA95A